MGSTRNIEAILDLARWAPSGDNTQPWRFEVVDDRHAVIRGHDTREYCVYDLDGWASQISIGALLETASLAASQLGWAMGVCRRGAACDESLDFDIEFTPQAGLTADPLASAIRQRSVQRRPYSMRPLRLDDRSALAAAVGPDHEVRWIEGHVGRARMAALLFRSARLRLVLPEAYRVHRDVIEWDAQFSTDRVPDGALGVSRAFLRMMKFAMHSWGRVQFFNRFLAGTWMPRIQMDLLPAIACGAHFVLLSRQPPRGIDDHVAGGRAMQRLWLTATCLGLSVQPELTPLIFARYAAQDRTFSARAGSLTSARRVGDRLRRIAGDDVARAGVFLGRIGYGPAVVSRSLRRDLRTLLLPGGAPFRPGQT